MLANRTAAAGHGLRRRGAIVHDHAAYSCKRAADGCRACGWSNCSNDSCHSCSMKTRIHLLQGIAKLAGDGTLGAIAAVEGVHLAVVSSVAARLPFGHVVERGTAFTYARVRDLAGAVRFATDGSLGLAARYADIGADAPPAGPARIRWLAALNGAIGDHLEASANPLAIPIGLWRGRHPLEPESAPLGRALDACGSTLVLFVHGLGMSELGWGAPCGGEFGSRMEHDGIGLALQLRYNSGRRIPANGRDLSQLLQRVHDAHRGRLRRLVLVGHSMGGLVCRSACEHARRERSSWADALDEVVCLGSPHFGAPLERVGDSASALLRAIPWTRPLAAVAESRSAGVKDLRHGWSSDLDRAEDETTRTGPDALQLPFADRVNWRLAAASLSARADGARARWLGDGLVPVPSALGRDRDARRALRLPASHRRVFTGLGHLDLLTHPDVYAQLREWLERLPRRTGDA